MPIRKRGKGWQLDVTVGARRIREQHPTEAAARVREAALVASGRLGETPAALRGRAVGHSGPIETIGALIDYCAQHRWADARAAPNLIRNGREAVAFFGPDYPLADISSAWCGRFADWLAERGNSNATINRKLSALSAALKTAAERGDLDALPRVARRRESEGRIRQVSASEEAALLHTLRLWGRKEEADLVAVLIDTGMRVRQEALRLRPADVLSAGGRFWVHIPDGKGGRPRRIPLTERARLILQGRAAIARAEGRDRLWSCTYDQLRRVWDRARDHMGLEADAEFVIHALRHTCASRMAERGVPLLTIKKFLGHSAFATTTRYAHLTPDALPEALAALQ